MSHAACPSMSLPPEGHPLASASSVALEDLVPESLVAVKNSRLVLATLKSRSLSGAAVEFAEHCRALFGVNQGHLEGHGKAWLPQYAPGDSQS